jgi:O-antigen ligase
MKIHETVTNSSASLRSSSHRGRIDLQNVAWFSLLVLIGGVGAIYPVFWLVCLAAVAMLGICWGVSVLLGRVGLELWQVIALTALSGYVVLNYGFDNLAIHLGGFPILVAYGMMYASLVLALVAHREWVAQAIKEPALLCLFGLLGLALLHLVTDIPSYGSWAFRDATMCFDGLFVLMGLLWARKTDSHHFVAKWLMVIFVTIMFYSYTLPWGEKLFSWSPVSGVYLPVPILGNYRGTGDWLLAGATFCICVGGYVIRRRSWLLSFLTMGLLLGIAITQVRRMYLGIVVVVVILIVAGEGKKFARLFILVPAAIGVLFVATTFGGLQISGRIGPVNLGFFVDHLRSLSGAEDTPGSDPQSRVIMAREAYQHFLQHPIFGEGFGQPLISIIDYDTGTVTRTPHNSSITYLARLGAVGFAFWIAFHFCLWTRFVYAFRQRRSSDKQVYSFVLWFFLFYVLLMMSSFVESPFEYPADAIPFFFLMGFALGLIRWHLSPKNKSEHRLAAFAGNVEKAYQ